MKTLRESILDDEEIISKNTNSILYLKDLAAKWKMVMKLMVLTLLEDH